MWDFDKFLSVLPSPRGHSRHDNHCGSCGIEPSISSPSQPLAVKFHHGQILASQWLPQGSESGGRICIALLLRNASAEMTGIHDSAHLARQARLQGMSWFRSRHTSVHVVPLVPPSALEVWDTCRSTVGSSGDRSTICLPKLRSIYFCSA